MNIEVETVIINDKEYRLDSLSEEAQTLFALHMEAEQLRDEASRKAAIHQAAVASLADAFTEAVLGNVSDSEVESDGTVTPIR
jgi:hypothetical protein